MKRITYLFLILFISCTAALGQGKAKYVFYFIGDGMGVNQVNTTEVYLSELQGNTVGVVPLQFTQFPVAGMATTFSATHSVTDSAAGGTALATGQKTYNGAIGVGTEYERITTIAERAKQSGKKVGIATSVSIDHATPASFYAHQTSRSKYYEIAMDIPASNFDFFAGGGFIRPTTSYEKKEMPSIYPILEEAGYTIARGYDDYKAKAASAKKMILMQQEGKDPGCIPYVLDRKEDDLTLPQITQSAIDFLMKDNKKGFFLMVEGGKIDWACHSNDAHTVVTEVIDMDEAVKIAFEFYKKHPRETLIVISADHETGGVAVGSSSYMTNFKAMQYQKQSLPALSDKVKEIRKEKGHNTTWEEMKALLTQTMGFWKELPISWTHEKMLRDSFEESFSAAANVIMVESMYAKSEPLAAKAKDVMNDIARSYWTTTGHTAGYVPVYAIGVGSDMFKGKIDNTDIPNRIAKIAGYK
ncbi:alkaline phosphatase [Bacteroides sp. 214]|uniref:alkaline phosphatase n=1 Tax=Bacteroides sp. 214 TaxID=2302935 RepID=UPI0013CF9706|nr:alkaline phosphatase [Bacteroides sp. 214]NDW12573.1 alkaline phosphatase [Bacteroides sp. 214]